MSLHPSTNPTYMYLQKVLDGRHLIQLPILLLPPSPLPRPLHLLLGQAMGHSLEDGLCMSTQVMAEEVEKELAICKLCEDAGEEVLGHDHG